jgi:serralysin
MCILCDAASMANSGNIFIDVLHGRSWLDVGKDRHITYYFDEASPAFLWTGHQKGAFRSALQEWANVANITFQEVSSPEGADLFETWVTPAEMTQIWGPAPGGTWPAAHFLPQGSGTTLGHWNSNRVNSSFSQFDLRPGNDGYRLMVHEIGHAIGLTHSHGSVQDPGGPIFPGLPPYPDGAFEAGTFGHNQMIYTIMSYNLGSHVYPAHLETQLRYSAPMSPMAFDIAAVQSMYGANTTHRAGSDTYVLPDVNEPGTGWRCIWDTGGTDTIRYDGNRNATIDLRPATLVVGDPIAGGAISRAENIYGGFTIANGVVIENAFGGKGHDTLIGNSADNVFDGGAGNDFLHGEAGNDTVIFSGPQAAYTVTEFSGGLSVVGPQGADTLFSVERLIFSDAILTPGNYGALFDPAFYLSQNPDVLAAGVDPLDHFNRFGWREGRDPNEFFSIDFYLGVNADARAFGGNPLGHYQSIGWKKGYDPGADFDIGLYLRNNPDVAAAGIDPLLHFLLAGRAEGRQAYAAIGNAVGGFDAQYYLQDNPDVAAARVDPRAHFNLHGWHEGRNPNGLFDTAGYLAAYADVAAAGINPLDHYSQSGWREGRDPSLAFDTRSYLTANPDVAAAGVNPLQHFLQHGIYEGRTAFSDATWFGA